MSQPRAVIIGAGIGGLATANLLAKTGWQVDVYEQQAAAGGRAGVLEMNGFKFDTGPSWYLMPEIYEHYFELLGLDVGELLELVRLDPGYKVFFDYHAPLTINSRVEADRAAFAALEPGADKALDKYLASAKLTYDLAIKYFLFNPFTRLHTVIQPEVLRHSIKLGRLLGTPLHDFVKRSFKHQVLQQTLEYAAVFLGTSPFKGPSMYHLMSHLDFEQGVFYPQGGIYEIIRVMQKTGEDLGVNYHFDSPVVAITTTAGKATGIELASGEKISADVVISNADLHFTETQLLPEASQTYPESYWEKRTPGPSALLMYLGISGELPELEHHNLMFVEDWRTNFSDIYEAHVWPDNPSMYVCKPSQTDPSVAPKGNENVFVLVPLPSGVYEESDKTEAYAERCLDLVANYCKVPDLRKRIVSQKLYGPGDFAGELNSWQGGALGLGHTLRQSAIFRPANKSKKLNNLYYVGGDTQPGIGLPLCLISAEIVYKRLTNDHSPGPLKELKVPKGGWNV